MKRTVFALLAGLSVLAGCAGVPPTPVERFYRLHTVTPSQPGKVLNGTVAVYLQADSLYAERPVVYSEEGDTRQLRQYHYHLWLYAPARLVSEHLVASLGKLAEFRSDGRAPYSLEGRVVRFDRVVGSKGSKAVVALELRLLNDGKFVAGRLYQAEQEAANDTMLAFVTATEQALSRIYSEWLADVAALPGKPG